MRRRRSFGGLRDIKDRQKLFAYAWDALDGQAAVEFVFSENSVAKVPAISQAITDWAQEIGDTSLRESTLLRIAHESLARSPEETGDWLARSGLSEKAKAGLR